MNVQVRYPVVLSPREKQIASKVVLAFGQFVCGFDVLRSQSGESNSSQTPVATLLLAALHQNKIQNVHSRVDLELVYQRSSVLLRPKVFFAFVAVLLS